MSWNGSIKGLKEFPPEDRPPSPVVFWAFRIMVGLGLLMVAVGLWAAWLRVRGRLYASRRLLLVQPGNGTSRFIALLSGWTVTRLADSPSRFMGCCAQPTASRLSGCPGVAVSLAGFVAVYLIVFGAGFAFLVRLMRRPPTVGESGPPPSVPTRTAGLTSATALHDGSMS